MFQLVVDSVSPSGSRPAFRPELMLRGITGVINAKGCWCWLVAEGRGECGVSAPTVTLQRSDQSLAGVFRLGSLRAAVLGKGTFARQGSAWLHSTHEIPENSACFASSVDHLLQNLETNPAALCRRGQEVEPDFCFHVTFHSWSFVLF